MPVPIASVLNLLLPQLCAFCGAEQPTGPICAQCFALLPWNRIFCEICGQAMAMAQPEGVACADCQSRAPTFCRARAPCLYSFPLDTTLKALKFRRQLSVVPALSQLLLPLLEKEFMNCDALVPVPLHRWRHAVRGFNQAMELCRPLQRSTALPIMNNVFRCKATRPQAGLSSAQRRKNVRGVFAIRGRARCHYPLIIDDVMTTGATCGQLATTLLRAGAKKVAVLTVARVRPG